MSGPTPYTSKELDLAEGRPPDLTFPSQPGLPPAGAPLTPILSLAFVNCAEPGLTLPICGCVAKTGPSILPGLCK